METWANAGAALGRCVAVADLEHCVVGVAQGWWGPGTVGNWGGAGAVRSTGGGELGRRWGAWATAGWAVVLGPRRPGRRVGQADLSRVGGWNEKPVQWIFRSRCVFSFSALLFFHFYLPRIRLYIWETSDFTLRRHFDCGFIRLRRQFSCLQTFADTFFVGRRNTDS